MQTLESPGYCTGSRFWTLRSGCSPANGFEATSLRTITAEAGANLGAVNYHFTSKDGLILEVLKRMFHPVNEHRLRLLDDLEREAGGKPVAVEAILEALFRPPLELVNQPTQGGWFYPRLLAYCLTEPGAYLKPLMRKSLRSRRGVFTWRCNGRARGFRRRKCAGGCNLRRGLSSIRRAIRNCWR